MRIRIRFSSVAKQFLSTLELIATIIVTVILIALSAISVVVPYLSDMLRAHEPMLIVVTTVYIVMFIHTLLTRLPQPLPSYEISMNSQSNKSHARGIMMNSNESVHTTHVYSINVPVGEQGMILDMAKEVLEKVDQDMIEGSKGSFSFQRILGISNSEDIEFAKQCLALHKSYSYFEVFLLDLIGEETIKTFPNVVIGDKDTVLITFPIRVENQSSGIVMRDRDFAERFLEYWHKLRESKNSYPIDSEVIARLEKKLEEKLLQNPDQ